VNPAPALGFRVKGERRQRPIKRRPLKRIPPTLAAWRFGKLRGTNVRGCSRVTGEEGGPESEEEKLKDYPRGERPCRGPRFRFLKHKNDE